MKIRKLPLFFAVFLFAAHLNAADLSFFIGGVKPGKIEYHDVQTSLDSSPIYGFRLGTDIVPFFGLEHTLAFSSDYLYPGSVSELKEVKGFVYSSDFILNIPAGFAVPYLTAGVGLVHQYGDSDLPVGTKFAFNYGGGLKFPHVAGPLGLRFDIRGYNAGLISNKLNLLEISGGIMFSLKR